MRQKIDQEISVVMYYSASKKMALPRIIQWQNKDYIVGEMGYIHKVREGKKTHHIYEFCDKQKSLSFRISLDSETLHWKLEYVSDGLTD